MGNKSLNSTPTNVALQGAERASGCHPSSYPSPLGTTSPLCPLKRQIQAPMGSFLGRESDSLKPLIDTKSLMILWGAQDPSFCAHSSSQLKHYSEVQNYKRHNCMRKINSQRVHEESWYRKNRNNTRQQILSEPWPVKNDISARIVFTVKRITY